MPKRLYTYCCRLCLHDGSVHGLFDIFSVGGLCQKILTVFNIKVTSQDACTTNICLACFNEALILEQQLQLFNKQKQTVHNNQQRLEKSSDPGTTTSELCAASHTAQATVVSGEANESQRLPVGVSTISSQAPKTASNVNIRDDGSRRLKFSPTLIAKTDSDETNKRKDTSKTANDKKRHSHSSSTKKPCSKGKTSDETLKSRSKTPESSSAAAKRARSTVEPAKTTDGNLQSSGSVCSNGPHAADGKGAPNSAKVRTAATGVKTNEAPKLDVPQPTVPYTPVRHAKKVVLPADNNALTIVTIADDANHNVQNTPNAVQRTEQNTSSHSSSTKVSGSKGKASGETSNRRSKTPISSSSAAKRPLQALVEPAKTTNLRTDLGGSDCSNGPNSVDGKTASNSAKVSVAATGVNPYQASNRGVPQQTASSTVGKQGQQFVPPVANNANAIDDLPTIEDDANQNVQNQVSTTTKDLAHRESIIVERRTSAPVIQKERGNKSSLGAKLMPTAKPLQGGLCSIPLANISSTVHQNESRIVVVSTTTNLTTTTATTSLATYGEQPIATSTNALNNAIVPAAASQLVSVGSDTPISQAASVGNRDDSTISNVVSPGNIIKRRHSTYIRVSSNLFDEPPEKAQFAMLNNNLLIRNVQTNVAPTQTNAPPLTVYSCLPVLPQGHRVQTVPNPEATMPSNSGMQNCNLINPYSINGRVQTTQQVNMAASQRPPNPVQAVASNSTNSGTAAGVNYAQRINATSTNPQPRSLSSVAMQQASVVTNASVTGLVNNNSQLNASVNRNSAYHSSHSATTQPVRPCYRCNICNIYCLVEASIDAHMQQVHLMEKNVLNCSKVYDGNIVRSLMALYRRKSIADPSILSGNRT